MVGWSRLGKNNEHHPKRPFMDKLCLGIPDHVPYGILCLIFARTQLHEEVIASDARFLKSIFEKNLEEFYLQNLESEFLFTDNELSINDLSGKLF